MAIAPPTAASEAVAVLESTQASSSLDHRSRAARWPRKRMAAKLATLHGGAIAILQKRSLAEKIGLSWRLASTQGMGRAIRGDSGNRRGVGRHQTSFLLDNPPPRHE
jgi:hypothetical protein